MVMRLLQKIVCLDIICLLGSQVVENIFLASVFYYHTVFQVSISNILVRELHSKSSSHTYHRPDKVSTCHEGHNEVDTIVTHSILFVQCKAMTSFPLSIITNPILFTTLMFLSFASFVEPKRMIRRAS